MPRGRRQNTQPTKLQDALVLHKYILSLLGCNDLQALSADLKDPALEGVDNDGISNIFYVLKDHLYAGYQIREEQLLEYDQNIVRHTKAINEKRQEKIQWKYYQYLALLFTEIYLDRYFSNRKGLLDDINRFLNDDFNFRTDTWHGISDFTDEDINKLAFWCATGSGKTLMMHVNILQYRHYAEKHHAKKINNTLILTPNEGLSSQHLQELYLSGFEARLFTKQGRGDFFNEREVKIIDINKLADTDGDKTVAVDSFEGNNLVFVDEGHKGSGGEVWKGYRNKLTEEGFSFEYSATFGQAVAAQSGSNRDALLQEYGKATLFDYSYRYFYNDGYGKDYRIMNMSSWDDEELLNMYLTAYILSIYEQTLVYESSPKVRNVFLLARPLGLFVGHSVVSSNGKKKSALTIEDKKTVTDVVRILLFLQSFISNPNIYISYIKSLFNPNEGVKNTKGYSLFANSFVLAKQDLKLGKEEEYAKETYYKVLQKIFHSNVPNAQLHVEKQKGDDGEIGLRVGTADYFGVINVGDADNLLNLCKDNGLDCQSREIGSTSLFASINKEDSPIYILIGSKKFSEGWSSWRVSTMGLMNVGRSEGSEIIQLFGRGVRLKGFRYSLKRSSALDSSYNPGPIPKGLKEIETLNIFGVRADYMKTFKDYLEGEGLPSNEEEYTEINIPTVNLLDNKKLKVVRLKDGYDFKKTVTVHPKDQINEVSVKVDWTPKVEALYSSERSGVYETVNIQEAKLTPNHLQLLNWDKIFFAIEQMKNERSWYNMELSSEMLRQMMANPDWYSLVVLSEQMEFRDYGSDVARWEDMTIALLRAYIDRAYRRSKGSWESQHMETVYLDAKDPNFFEEYRVEVRRDQTEWIEKLNQLREQIISGNFENDFQIYNDYIQALRFDKHLFYPIMCVKDKDDVGRRIMLDPNTNEPLIKVSPVALNKGETRFVKELRKYCEENQDGSLKGKEIYLLRNESRRGIGFFEANNFYPDFILWVNEGQKQRVVFIDPKGIRNLRGLKDVKIQLYKTLKDEIEPMLGDKDVTLDSFIISNTKYSDVRHFGSKEDFYANHVLFDKDDNDYVKRLFSKLENEIAELESKIQECIIKKQEILDNCIKK